MPEDATQTFVFLDLAGFTALTEAHGDTVAADIAEDFIDGVRRLLDDHDAREVKTMGDAVMAHSADAEAIACIAVCAIGDLGAAHGALAVRAGVHTGTAVRRRGDWFGRAVNIAARVSAHADADELLLTDDALAAAPRFAAGRVIEDLGPHRLRNVSDPVRLHRCTPLPRRAVDWDVDPVCRMALHAVEDAHVERVAGRTWRFCSVACAETFRRQPELFEQRAARRPG